MRPCSWEAYDREQGVHGTRVARGKCVMCVTCVKHGKGCATDAFAFDTCGWYVREVACFEVGSRCVLPGLPS